MNEKKFILNYSDEEFIPCECGIFIKRFGKYMNDEFNNFESILNQVLEECEFNGVCYVGKKRGKVLDEYIDQEVWEKSIVLKVRYFIFWCSGNELAQVWRNAKKDILYIEQIKNFENSKLVLFNGYVSRTNSDEDFENLKFLVKKACDMIRKERGIK